MKHFALVFMIAVLSSGCSLIFVDGPPKVRPGAPLPATADCTTGSTMPIVDIIFGISSLVMIKEMLEQTDDFGSEHVAVFAYPVGFFGSSVQGFRRTKACREFLATPFVPDTTGLHEASSWPRQSQPLGRLRPPEPPRQRSQTEDVGKRQE